MISFGLKLVNLRATPLGRVYFVVPWSISKWSAYGTNILPIVTHLISFIVVWVALNAMLVIGRHTLAFIC